MSESVADFKQRIAIIRRRIETGKEYSIVGASRVPAWCSDARGKTGRVRTADNSTGRFYGHRGASKTNQKDQITMKLTKDGAEALLPLIQKRIGGFRMKSYLDHEKDNARRAEENGCAYLTFKIEVKKDWKGGGSIYCPQMKCEISASNLATTIADLVQEFIDVEGGEQL